MQYAIESAAIPIFKFHKVV